MTCNNLAKWTNVRTGRQLCDITPTVINYIQQCEKTKKDSPQWGNFETTPLRVRNNIQHHRKTKKDFPQCGYFEISLRMPKALFGVFETPLSTVKKDIYQPVKSKQVFPRCGNFETPLPTVKNHMQRIGNFDRSSHRVATLRPHSPQ